MMRPVLAAGVFLAVTMGGCTGAPVTVMDHVVLPTGGQGFHEVDVRTDGPQSLVYWWEAAVEPVAFDVHVHHEDGVRYLVEEQSVAGNGTVDAPGGVVSFMWHNPANVSQALEYRLEGRFEILE